MALSIASLNSGSNGNCYYVGNAQDAVLIDAGISCRETVKRMTRLGLNIHKVRAIFVSHEHTDHIAGLAVLSKKFGLPVYITNAMMSNAGRHVDPQQIRFYRRDEPVIAGSLCIRAFSKYHDACDPHSFVVSADDIHIGVFTDLGRVCDNLIYHFSKCHAVFLEANYDSDMLHKGPYPYYLKKRISGGHGHLSNDEALRLFVEHKPAHMSHVLLSHLSRENNDPQLALDLFRKHCGDTHVAVASRYEESEVYHISGDACYDGVLQTKASQLSLFSQ